VSGCRQINRYPPDGRSGTLAFPLSGNQRLRYTVKSALPPFLFSPSSHSPQSALVLSPLSSPFVFPYPITIAFSLLHNLVLESVVLNLCPRSGLVAGLDLFYPSVRLIYTSAAVPSIKP
jgi:hypothetical protein